MKVLMENVAFIPEALADNVDIHQSAKTKKAIAILPPRVVQVLEKLHIQFQPERKRLLEVRKVRQLAYDAGVLPDYPTETNPEARLNWQVPAIPADLQKRRVEITGPVNSAKMVVQMLNRNEAGYRADTAMLDFEDSMKPSWENVVDGVLNVIAVAENRLQTIENGKHYVLNPDDQAVMMVRVRGLALEESNLRINGEPISGGLFDLVLTWMHTAPKLIAQGKTPKYYIPKTEYHEEARWWNAVFVALEEEIGVPEGTLRATFLIETLPAAFEMEEILYEFRTHAAGMNVGRWDKIFSDIKVLKNHPNRVMGDRATITIQPDTPWMYQYARRLIQVCHKHGAFAIGGMAAFTPGKTPELRAAQTAKVVADKELEVSLGHDGCWVSHPYFIRPALEQFTRDNQLEVLQHDLENQPDLLPQGRGPYTIEGLRTNVRVGIAYQEGWSRGIGCVAWDNLMEDLATLEISRAQVWQWLKHGITLEDGRMVTKALVSLVFEEELQKIEQELVDANASIQVLTAFKKAAFDAESLFLQEDFRPHLAIASSLAQ
ncbi:MAG: malate synthase A [Bacteroidetes Order II. Incertae sedis bacterium]|nr:malate synthase A [Bacteroidetes Order II. bacterium]